MTNTEALEILEQYQAWRRGADTEMLEPKDIGKAIDVAIDALKRTQWQPIETAPKDDSHFIGFTRKHGWHETCWADAQCKQRAFEKGENIWPFIYWIPLPPAP